METTDLTIANEIRNQLKVLGGWIMMSWGANSFVGGNNFLQFKVQGFLLKGFVKITLNGMDLYDIQFIKVKKGVPEVLKEVNDVYFDEMVDVIDRHVEKDCNDAEYEKKVRGTFKKL